MKIGYLAQLSPEVRWPPYDGPANHVRHVIAKLIERGHEVSFLARIDGEIVHSTNLNHFPIVNSQKKTFGKKSITERSVRRMQRIFRLPFFNYFESNRFARLCQNIMPDYDLLFERTSWMNYGGAMAAQQLKIPLVLEYNGDPLHDLKAKGVDPKGLQRKVSIALFKRTLATASHIVASGKGWENNLVEHWGVQRSRVTTIENGTPLLDLLERTQLKSFQQAVAEKPLQMVYLGGFYSWQGTSIAVQALQRIIERGLDVRLVMVGTGAQFEETRTLAKDLGLLNYITFTGPLMPEEFGPILANSEIGLSPYCGWQEYSGLKLFDYKAAGLAIIASGANGQPDTLRHEHTGWIVPPCDLDSLVEAMLLLIRQPEIRRTLGQNARIDAERLHSWERTVLELETLFNRLLPAIRKTTEIQPPDATRKSQ